MRLTKGYFNPFIGELIESYDGKFSNFPIVSEDIDSKIIENYLNSTIDYQDIEYDYPINSDAYPEEILNRIEGERRLAYVAFTRAKENLFIFSADDNYYSNSVINDKCISVLEKLSNINSLDMNQIILNLKDGLGVEQMKGFDILISSNNVFLYSFCSFILLDI